ncbi:MAG: 50S ribosomal protein L29 [Anaerolineae bacterium]
MKAAELRERTSDELRKALDDANQELFNLRFQAATGQLADIHRMRAVRKDLARILTMLKEREAGASTGEGR